MVTRGRHVDNNWGNCEVVIAVFVFGAQYCNQYTEDKMDDPIENIERWVCPKHKASILQSEGGEDDGISEPEEELHSDQSEGSPGDEARDYC